MLYALARWLLLLHPAVAVAAVAVAMTEVVAEVLLLISNYVT
jgi:hypothetical protein